jgi:hypothetical protein
MVFVLCVLSFRFCHSEGTFCIALFVIPKESFVSLCHSEGIFCITLFVIPQESFVSPCHSEGIFCIALSFRRNLLYRFLSFRRNLLYHFVIPKQPFKTTKDSFGMTKAQYKRFLRNDKSAVQKIPSE